MNNAAIAINNAGQIAGISDPPGDTTTHAVLWQNGAIINLGTLPGDFLSMSPGHQCARPGGWPLVRCELQLPRFPLGSWRDDRPQQPHSTWLSAVSDQAEGINDSGEIAGTAFIQSNREALAFLAIPAPTGQIAGDSVRKINLPENIRASLQRRLRLRHFGDGPTAQQ